MLVSYDKNTRRGTVVYYEDGSIEVLRVNNINEFRKPHIWAISGYSLYPFMDFKAEKMPDGIDYKTAHTYIAYKDNIVYLIVKPYHMIKDILALLKSLGVKGCIVLDGGGSSQLNWHGKGFKSSRKINSAIVIKG